MNDLPVVTSCDGCGAKCCQGVVMPPFIPMAEDEEWQALRSNHPTLYAELQAEYQRKANHNDWPDQAPCFWLDREAGKCRHYDQRPEICREYEMGGESCISHQARAK